MAVNFRNLFTNARKSAVYWAELAVLDFTSALANRMEQKNISRSALAGLLNTSPAYVTKILRGKSNFTIGSMTSIAHALGAKISITLDDQDAGAQELTASATVVNAVRPAPGTLILLSRREHPMHFDLQAMEAVNESRADMFADAA